MLFLFLEYDMEGLNNELEVGKYESCVTWRAGCAEQVNGFRVCYQSSKVCSYKVWGGKGFLLITKKNWNKLFSKVAFMV